MAKEIKKRASIMKKFEELTYSDSFLFGEVMMDEETSKKKALHIKFLAQIK